MVVFIYDTSSRISLYLTTTSAPKLNMMKEKFCSGFRQISDAQKPEILRSANLSDVLLNCIFIFVAAAGDYRE